MTTTVYTFCWNEIFLLPHFFEHYKWADKIIIYDNDSDDGSQEFIKSQPKAELRHFDTNNKMDDRTQIDLKNNCWKGDTSDWVIVCDMDEFLIGHEKLKKYVGEVCVFDCKGWEMVSEEVPTDFKTVNLKYHYPWWNYKALCFSPKVKRIRYSVGAHSCKPKPNNIYNDVLEFYHYATLSEDYIVEKWQRTFRRLSENNLKMKWGKYCFLSEEEQRDEFKKRLRWAKRGKNDIKIGQTT